MLEIRDLVKVYPGPVTALSGVSLTIPRGLYGLLGPNGSGKTTLMRILAGLLAPTSGSVSKDGVDVTHRPDLVQPHLGFLPQDFGFYPELTGQAMLRHLLVLKGVEAPGGLNALSEALLHRVNLAHDKDRKVGTYSGGMRQRLGIAQAIAGDPDLVIVDEPTVGLDPEERIRFFRLLSELGRYRTVLLSTHLVEDVAMLCPRFAVIRKGRVLAETTPAQARASIAGRVFEGFVEPADLATPSVAARLTQARLEEGRNVVRLHVPDGPPPDGFVPVPPTLEDAYMVLAGGAERGSTTASPGTSA